MQLERQDAQLIIGALDSLGVALTDHGHVWTEGEQAIYERAMELLGAPGSTIEEPHDEP